MVIGARTAAWSGEEGMRRIEYLQTTGTQWIDVGTTPQGYGSYEVDVDIYQYVYTGSVVGVWSDGNGLVREMSSSFSILFYQWRDIPVQSIIGRWKIKLDFGNGTITVNDTEYEYTRNSCTRSLRLAAWTNSSGGRMCKGKYYGFVVKKEDGTLVRDMVPVRIGSVGYMYDRANPTGGPLGNGLYANAGTGEFVLGPDVSASNGGGV